jgi:hypothetical protein
MRASHDDPHATKEAPPQPEPPHQAPNPPTPAAGDRDAGTLGRTERQMTPIEMVRCGSRCAVGSRSTPCSRWRYGRCPDEAHHHAAAITGTDHVENRHVRLRRGRHHPRPTGKLDCTIVDRRGPRHLSDAAGGAPRDRAAPRGEERIADARQAAVLAGFLRINHLERMTVLPCGTGEADRRFRSVDNAAKSVQHRLRKRPTMKIQRALELALIIGLAVAYAAAAAGLFGWLSAREVSLWALSGTGFALLATIALFVVSDRDIRRRFSSAG